MIQIKRIYAPADKNDGTRILVDRLWPRGVSKEKANLFMWAKDIAPTNTLRKAFNHEDDKWAYFQQAYLDELKHNPYTQTFLSIIKEHVAKGTVTLLYGAKDEAHNEAVVLQSFLESQLGL